MERPRHCICLRVGPARRAAQRPRPLRFLHPAPGVEGDGSGGGPQLFFGDGPAMTPASPAVRITGKRRTLFLPVVGTWYDLWVTSTKLSISLPSQLLERARQ